MTTLLARIAALVLLLFSSVGTAGAADGTKTHKGLYVIYDSSNSMWGELSDGSRKYEAGREALDTFLDGDFQGRLLAFRIYGHRRAGDCRDSELVVPFSAPDKAKAAIRKAVQGAKPTGKTPIDYSLRQALADFGDRSGDVILITDGIESCEADPCALLQAWRDKNVGIKVHIVGLGLSAKEKEAMACMVEAAGTKFTDAQSAADLASGLAEIKRSVTVVTAAEAKPEPPKGEAEFRYVVKSQTDGEAYYGTGTLTPVGGGDPNQVDTNARYVPPPGDYILEVGIRTKTHTAYRPVRRNVTIEPGKSVKPILDAPMPPRVSAGFELNGEPVRWAMIEAYQDDNKVWGFKGSDTVFVDEGRYTFVSSPNRVNENLTVEESFGPGDHKTIVFKLHQAVRAILKFKAAGSDIGYRVNSTLYRDGEKAWSIHQRNGGDVAPGDYEVRFESKIVQYRGTVTISPQPSKQTHTITVPSGYVTVIYKDVKGSEEAPKRVKVFPNDWPKLRGGMRTSNQRIALTPGTYTFTGWPAAKGYGNQELTIKAGDEHTITLQATRE